MSAVPRKGELGMETHGGPSGPSTSAIPENTSIGGEAISGAPHTVAPLPAQTVTAQLNGRSQGWESARRPGMKHRSADKLSAYGAKSGGEEGLGLESRESEEEGKGGRRGDFRGTRISASSSASSDEEGRGRAASRRASRGWPRADSSSPLPENVVPAGEPLACYGPGGAATRSAGKAAPRPRGPKAAPASMCPLPRGITATSCTILLLLLLLLVLRLALERGSLAGITLHMRSLKGLHRYDGATKDGPPVGESPDGASEAPGLKGQELPGTAAGVGTVAGAGLKGRELAGTAAGAGAEGEKLAGTAAGAGAEGEGGGEVKSVGDRQRDANQEADTSGEAGKGSDRGPAREDKHLAGGTPSLAVPELDAHAEEGVSEQTASPVQYTEVEGSADAEQKAQGAVDQTESLASSAGGGVSATPSSRPRYAWAPREGKFLLLFCVRGQISNRMICLRNHVIAAALLNRTLIAPLVLPSALTRNPRESFLPTWRRTTHEPGYYTPIVWDIGRTRACLGPNTVITDKEYYETPYYTAQRRPLLADVIHCWSGPPESCGNSSATNRSDSEHIHNCPWTTGDPSSRFTKKAGEEGPPEDEGPHVTQWHVPYDSYLAPFVYPDMAAAAGRGLRGAGSVPETAAASGATLLSAPGAALRGREDDEPLRAPRLQNSCLARDMASRDFIAALGAVADPVLVLGDMVNVGFKDRPLILSGAAPPAETNMAPRTRPLTMTHPGAGTSARRSSQAEASASPQRHAQRRLPQGDGSPRKGKLTSKTGGQLQAKGVPLSVLFSRRRHQRRLLEQALTVRPHGRMPPSQSRAAQSFPAPQQGGSEQPGFPRARDPRQEVNGVPIERGAGYCRDPLALLPARELISASEQAQGAIVGAAPYLGIHWRRGDFGVYCFFHSAYPNACFYSPVQAGKCAFQVAQSLGLQGIFLATNAPEAEVKGFKAKLGKLSSGQLSVVQLPASVTSSVHKDLWFALQHRGMVAGSREGCNASGIPSWESQHKVVGLTLEKLIAARSHVFLGSVESTFTRGIEDLRKSFGVWNRNDSYVCFKELEWAIFDGLPEDLIKEKKRRLKYSARKEQYRRLWESREKLRQRRERMQKRKANARRSSRIDRQERHPS